MVLSGNEAIACDLEAAAKARGTTIQDEYTRYQTSLILDEVTSALSEERPDVFIGAALAEVPGGTPTIYIKGPADSFIRDLVAAAEIEISIADDQPYSASELHERQSRVVRELQELGFTNYAVGSDIRTARMDACVTIEEVLPADPYAVAALLPADLRADVDLTMSEEPCAVDTIAP